MSANVYTLYLMRHGQIAGPAALYGATNVALAKEGWQQMQQQCNALSVAQIVTSPLQRCAAFAARYALENILTINTDDRLREADFGVWDGVPFDTISPAQWPELEQFWQSPAAVTFAQAEPLLAMQQRVISSWESHARSINKDTLMVTHGGVIRLILAHLLGQDWRVPEWYCALQIGYASITKVIVHPHSGIPPKVAFIGLPPYPIDGVWNAAQ